MSELINKSPYISEMQSTSTEGIAFKVRMCKEFPKTFKLGFFVNGIIKLSCTAYIKSMSI